MIRPCAWLCIWIFTVLLILVPGIITTVHFAKEDGDIHPAGPILVAVAGVIFFAGAGYLFVGYCVSAYCARHAHNLFARGEAVSMNDMETGVCCPQGSHPAVPQQQQQPGSGGPESAAPFVCPGTSIPQNASQLVAGPTGKRFGFKLGFPLGKIKKYLALKLKKGDKEQGVEQDVEAAASVNNDVELQGQTNAQAVASDAEARQSVETQVEAGPEAQAPKPM